MALFDKIGNFAKNTGAQASNLVEQGKLKAKIAEEKNKINGFKAQLGDIFYVAYKDNTEPAGEAVELCTQIAECEAAIESMQDEIQALKNENVKLEDTKDDRDDAVVCSACNAENPAGTKFCSNCGAKIEPKAEPAAAVCSGCGQTLPAGTKFCPNCGAKIGE